MYLAFLIDIVEWIKRDEEWFLLHFYILSLLYIKEESLKKFEIDKVKEKG